MFWSSEAWAFEACLLLQWIHGEL